MAGGDSNRDALGPWSEADLAGTARTFIGLGADADLPAYVRFLSAVAKLLRRRRVQPSSSTDEAKPAVFLLEPTARALGEQSPIRVPMLNNGLTPINGRLWFVSQVVVAGSFVDLDDLDDDAIFAAVTDILELGDAPAVLFDPRSNPPEARFYANGLANPEEYVSLDLGLTPVSLDRVFAAIDRVHETCLVTPEAQVTSGNLWAENTKWWASDEAEDRVQLQLKAGLATAFPTCTIRHEQTGATGRLDLEIEEADVVNVGQVTRHAVLELKVLRSYGSTGRTVSAQYTLDWVEKGVKQADAYRTEKNALAAALCCFDMRKDDSGEGCFGHVQELASRLDVRLRVWFLFATSEQYRDALAARRQGE